MNPKILYVEWIDSQSQADWTKLNELDNELHMTISVGFLVKETDKHLCLALSWDKQTGSVNCWCDIPKVSIKKKRVIDGTRRGR